MAEQHKDEIQQRRYMSLTSLEQTKAMMVSFASDIDDAAREVT